MYSVVLMAALSQSAAVPDFGRRGGGCGGCHGGCYGGCGGCYGGGWGGCYGGGCYGGGCYGGGWCGCCGGGWGGCYGGGWGGCYGGGWGGCYGGGIGYTGCYGGIISGGCFGGTVTNPGQMTIVPGGGGLPGVTGGGGTPGITGGGTDKIKEEDKPGRDGRKKTTDEESRGITEGTGTIIVSLPANAQLFFDGKPTRSTGTRRVFTSPALEAGQTYHYELKSIYVRNGQVKTRTEQVSIAAGETTYVYINAPERQVVSTQR